MKKILKIVFLILISLGISAGVCVLALKFNPLGLETSGFGLVEYFLIVPIGLILLSVILVYLYLTGKLNNTYTVFLISVSLPGFYYLLTFLYSLV